MCQPSLMPVMAKVISVSARDGHGLGKTPCRSITLVTGEGVQGDAHCGKTVKHRSRIAKDPTQPNLRQVHLIHAELLDEVAAKGFAVSPGDLGENILTRGIDLLGLSTGTILRFPSGAAIEVTGLRNPCNQINGHTPGLMNALIDHEADGSLIRKGGVMGVVRGSGAVNVGDEIEVLLPEGMQFSLLPV
jgi:MOSC domain-containing protein YiiM